MTEIIANTDDAIKAATDELILALDSKTATKAKIEEIESESENSDFPKLPPPPKLPKETKKSGN